MPSLLAKAAIASLPGEIADTIEVLGEDRRTQAVTITIPLSALEEWCETASSHDPSIRTELAKADETIDSLMAELRVALSVISKIAAITEPEVAVNTTTAELIEHIHEIARELL